ncbi:hypothetical protein DJ013_10205 [Arcticibacterium luteifluviistationis]|uniref:Uncharacterized protein n=2 Tax=Arcticibacterium luteifluviistationis TaxID=1784714 RepID=A0A2Z4GB64_9BACT|nr:hypothetical protein DJ013_10205 [Arcticibacterium luteifluviistationis]
MAQKPVAVVPSNYDISDNLDLEAVASIFGESRDLEDFEYRLNDPKSKISNLDLNEDGYVDYLRVVESVERGIHIIAIQAALGNDLFQDVATIDVEKDTYNKPQIQFIGHPYFYGSNYIIQPLYYHTPFIVSSFWGPSYITWQSPYYYGYYPSYYNHWRPSPVHQYVTNVHVYRNEKNTYKYVPERRSTTVSPLVRDNRRNDYVAKKPTQTFETRNKTLGNKQDLQLRRNTNSSTNNRTSENAVPRDRTSNTNNTDRSSRPTANPTPSERTPKNTPSTRQPTSTPSTRNPTSTPTTRKPASTPTTREPASTPTTRKPASTPTTRKPASTTPKPRSNTKESDKD